MVPFCFVGPGGGGGEVETFWFWVWCCFWICFWVVGDIGMKMRLVVKMIGNEVECCEDEEEEEDWYRGEEIFCEESVDVDVHGI